jgi:hypothetical protein
MSVPRASLEQSITTMKEHIAGKLFELEVDLDEDG